MDKDVLIRFIQAVEAIFGRINSKRLMTLYGFLLFLLYSKEMTELAVYLGALVSLLTLWTFERDASKRKEPPSDSVTATA